MLQNLELHGRLSYGGIFVTFSPGSPLSYFEPIPKCILRVCTCWSIDDLIAFPPFDFPRKLLCEVKLWFNARFLHACGIISEFLKGICYGGLFANSTNPSGKKSIGIRSFCWRLFRKICKFVVKRLSRGILTPEKRSQEPLSAPQLEGWEVRQLSARGIQIDCMRESKRLLRVHILPFFMSQHFSFMRLISSWKTQPNLFFQPPNSTP